MRVWGVGSCGIAGTFRVFEQRFDKLYKRKAMVHHYQSFLGNDEAHSVSLSLSLLLLSPPPRSSLTLSWLVA
jgi:hypothetical protein